MAPVNFAAFFVFATPLGYTFFSAVQFLKFCIGNSADAGAAAKRLNATEKKMNLRMT